MDGLSIPPLKKLRLRVAGDNNYIGLSKSNETLESAMICQFSVDMVMPRSCPSPFQSFNYLTYFDTRNL